MATEGTREGGSSMNRGQGKYFDREKRPGGGTRFQKSDRSGAPRGDRQAGGDRPPRGNGNRSYGEKSYGDRPYGDRPPRNERPNRNYGGAPKFPKKDEDEEDRGRRSKPLASQISAFIAEKRACGCKYEKEAKTFQTLDRFLVEQGINTPVLPELVVEKWIEKRPNEKRKNQKWRLNFTKLTDFQLQMVIVALRA